MRPTIFVFVLGFTCIFTAVIPLILISVRSSDKAVIESDAELGLHFMDINNPHRVSPADIGVADGKNNVNTGPPSAFNDVREGYKRGSLWITPSDTYMCLDNSVGVANWKTIYNLPAVAAHIADTSNPHGYTASSVGLGNVLNIKDYLQAEILPSTANDITEGYGITSRWIGPNDSAYICANSDPGLVRWESMTLKNNTDALAFYKVNLTATESTSLELLSNGTRMSVRQNVRDAYDQLVFSPNVSTMKYLNIVGNDTAFAVPGIATFHWVSGATIRTHAMSLYADSDTQVGFRLAAQEYVLGIDASDDSFAIAHGNTLGSNNLLTVLNGNIIVSGNLSAENLFTAAYTPAISNSTGFASISTFPTHYAKCGNVVSFHTQMDVDYGGNTAFFFEVDVPTSATFNHANSLAGIVQQKTHLNWDSMSVRANTTNQSMDFLCTLSSSSSIADTLYFTVMYEVI